MNYGTFIEPVLAEYPRVNNEKFYTDKYLLHIISNQGLYQRIFKSVDKALQYFNECKEYFFVFNLPHYGIKKRYSGKNIKELFSIRGNGILRKNKIDQLFYFIYKNREFYNKIYRAIEYAKINYQNVTEYSISVEPPPDFYNKELYRRFNYDVKEILDIYRVGINDKKNNNFPIPLFWN